MRIDLTGRRFGRLSVVSFDGIRGNGESYWKCVCDCGNTVSVGRGNLKLGITQSCGCLQKERTSQARKKRPIYDLSGAYGIGYTVNTGKAFFFDLDDYDLISPYSWFENDQGYIVAVNENGKHIRLHRLVTNIEAGIDHKNTKRFDNRKQNLRPATKQENGVNRGCNKNNSLGVKGVSKIKNRYYARICKDGKQIYLGGYPTLELAAKARRDAEIRLFGEFAYQGGDSIE